MQAVDTEWASCVLVMLVLSRLCLGEAWLFGSGKERTALARTACFLTFSYIDVTPTPRLNTLVLSQRSLCTQNRKTLFTLLHIARYALWLCHLSSHLVPWLVGCALTACSLNGCKDTITKDLRDLSELSYLDSLNIVLLSTSNGNTFTRI